IDYGVSLLRREALERIPPDQPYDLADLYGALVAEGRMAGYEVTRRFYEIGSPRGLEETRAYLMRNAAWRHPRRDVLSFTTTFLSEATQILAQIDPAPIERMVELLVGLRRRSGRLFFLGVGGSAANCAHAVNDFRKIADIEAYSATDNVSELT